MNSFWLIEDCIFANDFTFFDRSFQKNVKSHVFLKSEKNVKYIFSNSGSRQSYDLVLMVFFKFFWHVKCIWMF